MFRPGSRVLLLVAVLTTPVGAAPNLVPNPSFETNTQCPSMIDLATGQVHYAAPWIRAGSTPDYFHHCGLIASVETPANAMGSQCPYGSTCGTTPPGGYAGIVAYQAQATDAREYIQSPLSSPLVAGLKYRVRFHVSLAEFFEYGVDRMGAHLRTGAIDPNNVPAMAPQVQNPPTQVLSDKTNWMMISGTFKANGGEDHVVLGNLATDANTMALSTGSGGFTQAYYYVDMVTVKRADITDITILPPPGGGDTWIATLSGGQPNSPAWLYCSGDLGGSSVSGNQLELRGTPMQLAQATTDAAGSATFSWSLNAASACANALGKFYLEALVVDPTNGDGEDSDEEIVDLTTTDVAPGSAQAGVLGNVIASPNPFNPMTTVSYELQRPGAVRVELFNVAGQSVRVLENGTPRSSGVHQLLWNGRDQRGQQVAAGTYYCRVVSGDERRSLSMVLVK